MSASMAEGMAEVLAAHAVEYREWYWDDGWNMIYKSVCRTCGELPEGPDKSTHQAEVLAANGFGDVREARAKALEDAATVLARLPYVSPFGQGRETYERMLAIRRGNTDAWLKARAEEGAETMSRPVDAVLANLAAVYRPQLIAAGYDPDDPDLTAKMEADTRPLLEFYGEA